MVPSHDVPLVAVDVWYHVGSGHETYGKSGFAHLFEHMLFQGSKNVGADKHFELLKKIGVTDVNGTTNPDRTNYYEVVPSNQLATALWLESDRMAHLLPLLTAESLKNQIDVVRNERRQRYDNVPYGKTRFAAAAALYPEGHPYRYLTIGRHEDLEAASVEDVKNFYRTWYVPANATLCIAGDIDVPATKKLVERWFGGFPKSAKPPVISAPPPTPKATEVVVDDAFAKLRRLQLVWISPANFAPGDAELDIAAYVLGDQGTGRLYRSLVVEKGLAQNVMVYQGGRSFSGEFEIAVTLRSDADLALVKKTISDELARMTRELISDRERTRALTNLEASKIYSLESVLSRAEILQTFNHYLGDPDRMQWDLDRYRNVTPAQVRDTVARVLQPAHMTTILTRPAAAASGGK